MSKQMTAAALVMRHGKGLVGAKVNTPPMGTYPGGVATVTAVGHDSGAPEIAFLVKHPTWTGGFGGGCEDGIIGIFDHELVSVVEEARGDG